MLLWPCLDLCLGCRVCAADEDMSIVPARRQTLGVETGRSDRISCTRIAGALWT